MQQAPVVEVDEGVYSFRNEAAYALMYQLQAALADPQPGTVHNISIFTKVGSMTGSINLIINPKET